MTDLKIHKKNIENCLVFFAEKFLRKLKDKYNYTFKK
jgi:hypothetical protein